MLNIFFHSLCLIALVCFPFQTVNAADQWVNLGPGGGGWYRSVAFSPHEDKLFIGSDCGGIYVSTDFENFTINNRDLINTYINSIYFHPTQKDIVFLGTKGGIAKSTDGGSTWQMKRNGFPPIDTHKQTASVYAMAIDSNNPNIVYAGIGVERRFGRQGNTEKEGYYYKSIDAGETWAESLVNSSITDESIMTIVIDPTDSNKLFLLSESKLFVSTNAGGSWSFHGTLPYDERIYTYLAIKRDDPNVMLLSYAERGLSYETGVFKSTNGGNSWNATDMVYAENESAKGIKKITSHPSDNKTFYVNFHRDRTRGVCVTYDDGDTWNIQITNDPNKDTTFWSGWSEHATAFDINPRNLDIMCYVNDMDIHLTKDSGNSWPIISSRHVPGNPDFYTSSGADILCANTVAVNPLNPEEIYLAYRDVALWKTYDGGKSMINMRPMGTVNTIYGDSYTVAIDPDATNIVYAHREIGTSDSAIYKTTDSGNNWEQVSPALGDWIQKLIIAPTGTVTSRTIYLGSYGSGVYKSTDSGDTWATKNTGLPDNKLVTDLDINPGNPETIYICTRYNVNTEPKDGYVAKSTDGGNSWNIVLTPIDARSLAVDPNNPETIYTGNRDYSGVARNKIFWKSTDEGENWTFLPGDTFNVGFFERELPRYYYLSTIAVDPKTPGRLYVGLCDDAGDVRNGGGIWVSDDYGDNWNIFDFDGLGKLDIRKLIVDPVDSSRIYAATTGDGIFRYGPDPSQVDITPPSKPFGLRIVAPSP